MTRERLMAADAVIVFDERHRDAITRVLDYWLRRYEVKNFWRLWEFDYICGLKRFLC